MNLSTKLLTLEFFGLPGSGKTSVENLLCSRLATAFSCKIGRRRDIHRWFGNKSYTFKIILLSKNIKWFFLFFTKSVLSNRSKNYTDIQFYRRIFFLYKDLCAFTEFHKVNNFSVQLLDQSDLQNLWSVWFNREKPSDQYIEECLRTLQGNFWQNRKFVMFTCDIQTLMDRITDRNHGGSRLENLKGEDLMNILSHEMEFMALIYNAMNRLNLDVLIVNSTENPEMTGRKILDWIESS